MAVCKLARDIEPWRCDEPQEYLSDWRGWTRIMLLSGGGRSVSTHRQIETPSSFVPREG
jgi:hypothetical protein